MKKTAGKTPRKSGKPSATRPSWLPQSLLDAEAKENAGRGKKSGGHATAKTQSTKPAKATKPPKPPKTSTRGATDRVPASASKGRLISSRHDPWAEREARRYENPIASREAILALLAKAPGPLSAEELAQVLDLTAPDRFDPLTRRLAAMLRDGQVLVNRRGGYVPAEKTNLIAGRIIANPEGFGFLHPDAGGEDLFLPPREMRAVFHGDRVLAAVTAVDHRGRSEGKVVSVLERRVQRLVGRFHERAGVGRVTPDDKRLQHDVLIASDARLGAKSGQLVVCELIDPLETGRPHGEVVPIGRILTVLGDSLTPSLVVQVAIHGHGLPHEFPEQVLEQAAEIPIQVSATECAERVDLRELPLVTIDGEDARDFDDAVWCQPNRNGFRLVVAIADVSHYVQPESPLDDEAQLRATSVYFPGFVIPMLPETLSNGICSLRPNEDRLAFVCDMQVDHEGEVTRAKFHEAVIRSHARLTYTQVWRAIGEDDAQARAELGPLLPQIEHLLQLYRVLAKARAARGAIEFETGEVHFILGPDGEVVQGGMRERNDAHKLIEECMIAANVQAARYLLKKSIPAPYRVHDRPPEQKYADLEEFLAEFQLRMPPWSKVQPRDFTQLLKKVRKRADAALIESVLLRSQSLAVYAPQNIGHFGLALDAYAHFTSPIRRYPDVLVHRAIKHALAGGHPNDYRYGPHDMAQLCLQCSERGRRAEEAEREVDERYRAAWMEQHVGSQFDGIVSGVTSFGLFVEMSESKVTGLVHVTQLPKDWYQFDPVRRVLSGERSGAAWRQGDAVRVLVLRASVEDKRIDLRLVSNEAAGKTRATRTRWA
ncbi:MAG TPA: ribonuclease R [Chiayiivirga sp.]|nr:ribonuclease R [Chiayiivirga sp.]